MGTSKVSKQRLEKLLFAQTYSEILEARLEN